jgi:hypothetical protein
MKCPACGRGFDMRDLGQVLEHVHDAEFDIIEGDAAARCGEPTDWFAEAAYSTFTCLASIHLLLLRARRADYTTG